MPFGGIAIVPTVVGVLLLVIDRASRKKSRRIETSLCGVALTTAHVVIVVAVKHVAVTAVQIVVMGAAVVVPAHVGAAPRRMAPSQQQRNVVAAKPETTWQLTRWVPFGGMMLPRSAAA